MALTICPECKGKVSDKAEFCPHCGLPKKYILLQQTETENEKLIDLVVPEGACNISSSMYKDRADIKSVILPKSLHFMGRRAFEGCINLKEVTIPGGLKTVSIDAFKNCINLINVTLEEGVTEIGGGAFSGCVNLKKVIMPSTLRIINSAFHGCKNLKYVNIPETITVIVGGTFDECPKLTIPKELTSHPMPESYDYDYDEYDNGNEYW